MNFDIWELHCLLIFSVTPLSPKWQSIKNSYQLCINSLFWLCYKIVYLDILMLFLYMTRLVATTYCASVMVCLQIVLVCYHLSAYLTPSWCCRWLSSVSSMNRNIVKCWTSMGQQTKGMQVYRHWAIGRLSKMVKGIPAAPPTAPTQPRQSRRQWETLLAWVAAPWAVFRTSPTFPPLLTAMHNLTLTTIIAIERMHWHSEKSHISSMSGKDKTQKLIVLMIII